MKPLYILQRKKAGMQPDSTPFISVITLNYNQTDVTCAFLESTRAWKYPHYEILVCDMASAEDPSPKIPPGKYPNTRLLLSKQNLGFAGGNNWGMRQAKGDYYFIVNNDTEVTPDLLERLLEPFSQDATIGVTCPKIKYYDYPDTIQYAGFNPMNHFTGRTTSVGILEKDRGQYDVSGPTNGAHGCAMMVKKAVVEKTGMFPEKFFLYYEEWDWSARIRKAGFRIWYTAPAVIYHKESVSVGKSNPMKVYYHTRNRILYIRRNADFFQKLIFFLFFWLFTFPKNMIRYLIRKQYAQGRNFARGAFWNLFRSSRSPV